MDPVVRWATCALTQLAFVRLFVTPAVVGVVKPASEALSVLGAMVSDRQHEYWPDLPSLQARGWLSRFARVLGHRQVNDLYLLELARRHGGRWLTFDGRAASLGEPAAVEVLGLPRSG